MIYPPLWLWLLAFAFTFAGLFFSRSRSASTFLARLPGWFCGLLALASLVGMWFLLNAQFGGLIFHVSLP